MKDLIEQALAMIQDRPKEEIDLMHYVLTMEDDLKVADYVNLKDQAE